MRRTLGLLGFAILTSATVGLLAAPAGASLTGDCEAGGTLMSDGVPYNAAELPDEVIVQAKDSVMWHGSAGDGGDAEGKGPERQIKGEVVVDFPFGSVTVGDWDESSTTYSNAGTYDWDVSDLLAGIPIPVSGYHEELGIRCDGSGVVKIDGTSPIAYVSALFMVISLVGIGISVVPVKVV